MLRCEYICDQKQKLKIFWNFDKKNYVLVESVFSRENISVDIQTYGHTDIQTHTCDFNIVWYDMKKVS